MKNSPWAPAILLLLLCACNPSSKTNGSTTYKGKLEIKALCMNYTLALVEGNADSSLINTS